MMNPFVRVGVACFVWKDDKFLRGQRKGSHGSGTWSVPGGHLEWNESWEEAAAREVMEETGVSIKNIHFLAVTNDIMTLDQKHYISIWMEADWESGDSVLNEPNKWINQGWYDFATLPKPLFEPCWQNLHQVAPQLFS